MEATQPKMEPCKSQNDPTWNLQHYFFRVQNGMTFGRENFYFETSKVQRGSMPLKPKKGVQNVYVEPNMDSDTSPATQNGALETLKLFQHGKHKAFFLVKNGNPP